MWHIMLKSWALFSLALWARFFSSHAHSTGKRLRPERSSDLPEVTQQRSERAEIQAPPSNQSLQCSLDCLSSIRPWIWLLLLPRPDSPSPPGQKLPHCSLLRSLPSLCMPPAGLTHTERGGGCGTGRSWDALPKGRAWPSFVLVKRKEEKGHLLRPPCVPTQFHNNSMRSGYSHFLEENAEATLHPLTPTLLKGSGEQLRSISEPLFASLGPGTCLSGPQEK